MGTANLLIKIKEGESLSAETSPSLLFTKYIFLHNYGTIFKYNLMTAD